MAKYPKFEHDSLPSKKKRNEKMARSKKRQTILERGLEQSEDDVWFAE